MLYVNQGYNDENQRTENETTKPPMPAKWQPPKPRKPPMAVSNSAAFIKPTISSEIRKTGEHQR